MPTAPGSRRDRPAKPALSLQWIVAETISIMRTEGLERATMRRVAQALDTGPASLYVYVANLNDDQPRPVKTTNAVSLAGGVDPQIPDAGDLQDAALQIAELIEHEQRVVAGALVMAVPDAHLLLAMRRADA